MDEMVFLGTLVALVAAGIWLARRIVNKQTGRKPNHPVYHEMTHRKHSHRPARHNLVSSHSANKKHDGGDIWRSSRVKTGESRWESGVVAANKILTDSELALEKREPETGHGLPGSSYQPGSTPRNPARSADRGRGRS